MKSVKKSMACVLTVFLLMTSALWFVPSRDVHAGGGVYAKLMSLKSKFPDEKFWNHIVPASEAGRDCTNEAYANNVTNTPCKAHRAAVGASAGDYDCNYFDGGIQCCGFAKKVFYDVFGERESSNTLIQHPGSSGVKVGDFVKFTWEHYAVVLTVGSSTFTVVECNLDQSGQAYNCKIRWNHSYNLSDIQYYVHSHNWDSVENTNVEPSVSWSTYSSQEIKEGKVLLAKTASLSGATMDNVSTVGIDVYNSSNTLVKSKEENPDRSGQTYVHIWYDLSSELGLSITPGTVYKYSFWVKINGKKYESTRETVTCPPVYTVKFDSQGGSSVSQMTVGKNQTISTLPTSTRSGFVLDGWYTAASGGTKLTTSTKITGNITYYAHWNKSTYSITLSSVSNGTASLSKTSAAQGDEITVTTTPATGYALDKITVNGTAISGNKFTMPAKNTTVAVTFKKVSYSVSLSSVSNGTASLSKTSAYYGDEITVTTTPATGYVLDKITVNGTAISGNKFTMPAKNTTVAVTFKKATYTVTLSTVTNGTASLSKTSANAGDEITVTVSPSSGFELDYIKVNGTAISGNKFTMPAKNTTVEVAFKEKVHTLTKVAAKPATCTEDGNITYYVCKDTECGCKKIYSDAAGQNEISLADTVVPATGHTLEKVAAKEAKCTEKGHLAYWKCTKCGKMFKDSEGKLEITAENIEVDALGHDKDNLKHVQAKKETYKEDGNIEHYICPRCGKKFADPDCKKELTEAEIVIPKKGAAELGETAVIDGLKYKVTNPSTDGTGTVTLTGVDEKKASVVIPGTVEIKESTYIVDRIAAKAFYKDLTITSVYIGANIRFIDSCAFYGCKNLVKVSGGGKVETIAASVFAYCSKLKTFVITSPVLRQIGSGAFYKDKKLKTIYIKNTVKLTKAGVKKSLKGSSVKKVKVKKSKVKSYKKIFKKKNSGRSVKVKK